MGLDAYVVPLGLQVGGERVTGQDKANWIENHIKKWKVEYIYFWADTFLAWSNKEFDEFVEMYKDIKLPFWCQTRIETITRDKFIKLKEVGLNRITFGIGYDKI